VDEAFLFSFAENEVTVLDLGLSIMYRVIKKKTNQECYITFRLRICILAMHSRFIGCLPLEKSIKN
jgi:hypothetical protein